MSSTQTSLVKIRRNAIIGSIILIAIATLHLIKGDDISYIFLYSLAGFLFIVGGFFPKILKRITDTIGAIVTGFILSLLFFLVVTPIGLLMKILGKDPLSKSINKKQNSYWVDKDLGAGISDYTRQF